MNAKQRRKRDREVKSFIKKIGIELVGALDEIADKIESGEYSLERVVKENRELTCEIKRFINNEH